MIGGPLRIDWRENDTPEALKEAYQSQRDVSIRARVHLLCWYAADGRSKRRQRLWESITAALRDG